MAGMSVTSTVSRCNRSFRIAREIPRFSSDYLRDNDGRTKAINALEFLRD